MELITEAATEIFITAAVTLSAFYFKKLTNKLSEQELIKTGVVAILQDRILTYGRELLAAGEIELDEMKNFESLYEVYHSLGGNSTGTEIFDRVKSLKLKED